MFTQVLPAPPAVLEMVTAAGPYALFLLALLWLRLERAERIETQKFMREYLEADAKAKEAQANAWRALRFAMFRKGVIPAEQVDE